jgi:site-specific recombinase XerD
MKPLSPNTEDQYTRVLARASFGGVESWTESNKALLRAAAKKRLGEGKLDRGRAEAIIGSTTPQWAPKRVIKPPTEKELIGYEQAASVLPPGRRALALLPLAMGLRSKELLTVTRDSVERALDSGELLVMRKSGKEQLLSAKRAEPLLRDLLKAPKAHPRGQLPKATRGRPATRWTQAGEILSAGQYITAYHLFHRLVRDLGKQAGVEDFHPHALRHGFAARMLRDGAPIPAIQWFLGHENIQTTLRYVHAGNADAEKFLREWEPENPG